MGIPPSLYNPVKRYAFCSKNNEVIIEGEKPVTAVPVIISAPALRARSASHLYVPRTFSTAAPGFSPSMMTSLFLEQNA